MPDKTASPPPAYFLSLSLENVRSFGEKQTISFARPNGRPAQWTIILGDNGVGKTTVLKALAAMMPVNSDSNGIEPAYNIKWPSLWLPVRNGRQAISKRTTGLFTISEEEQKMPDFRLAVMDCVIQTGDKLLDIFSKDKAKIKNYGLALPFNSMQPLGRQWAKTIAEAEGIICYGYGAGRTVGNSALSDTPAIESNCISLFDDRADLLNPEEWFLNIDYGSKLAGENADQLNKARTLVEEMLKTVLPGVKELRIASSGTPQKPQISLQFLLFGTWVRLRDMSLGYQTLVVWLTDFASKLFIRYPDSPNPLEMPAIVLIDEIDLHLHPEWQRKLIGFLSGIFKNTQFIATAHSPLVVQAAGDEGANVVLLRREGDQTVVVKDLPDVRRWRIEQILTSELFGLETARSLKAEEKLKRRAELLTQPRRTAAERRELEALTRELDAEPLGELPSEREADAVLQELRQRLRRKDSSDPAAV